MFNDYFNSISDNDDREFINTVFFDLANSLHENQEPPKYKINATKSVTIYRDERKKLIDLLNCIL